MLVVPKLGGEPKLLTREPLQDLSDTVFVTVDGGTVKMAVADFQGTAHRLSHFFGRDPVRAEGPEPYGGDQGTTAQPPLRDDCGVNAHIFQSNSFDKRR